MSCGGLYPCCSIEAESKQPRANGRDWPSVDVTMDSSSQPCRLRHESGCLNLLPGGKKFFFSARSNLVSHPIVRSTEAHFTQATMERPSKKMRTLMDDDSSDSGDESGGVPIHNKSSDASFKINEDYARRFEYNKKREEVQKCM